MPHNTAKCWYCCFTGKKPCHREVYSESVTSTKMRLVNHCRNQMSYSHQPVVGSHSSWLTIFQVQLSWGCQSCTWIKGWINSDHWIWKKPVNKSCWSKEQSSTQHWDKYHPSFWELSAVQSTGYRSFCSYAHRNFSVQSPQGEPVSPYLSYPANT